MLSGIFAYFLEMIFAGNVSRDMSDTLAGGNPIGCGNTSMEITPTAGGEEYNCNGGVKIYPITVIDDCSRKILTCCLYTRERAKEVGKDAQISK